MTRVIQIFNAASDVFFKKRQTMFARSDIKKQLGLSSHDWDMGYTAVFQGMVENCPEKSNKVLSKYRGVFKRIGRGIYTFTEYGASLIENQKQF